MLFAEDGKRALMLAMQEAGRLGHWELGTEHLLLGLIAAKGPATEQLQNRGMTLASVRRVVVARHPIPDEAGCGRLPFTAELDGVLRATALATEGRPIGSLDLLIALENAGAMIVFAEPANNTFPA